MDCPGSVRVFQICVSGSTPVYLSSPQPSDEEGWTTSAGGNPPKPQLKPYSKRLAFGWQPAKTVRLGPGQGYRAGV